MNRRSLLKAGLATAQVTLAAKLGLLWPTGVLADAWPSDAFFAKGFDDALTAMLGEAIPEESDAVRLTAPDLAENGATVPVMVEASLAPPFVISLFSAKNPTPAVARFEVSDRLEATIATRIKMAETGELVAVVSAAGKHLSARRVVKVVTGGCA